MNFSKIIFLLIFFGISTAFCQIQTNDSTRNGKVIFTQKNGLKVKGNFKNKKRHKIWTWYNVDGTLHKQIKYKNGKTIWILYFEKNKAWLKINRHGKRKVIRPCNCREYDY